MKPYKWRIYADNNIEKEIIDHLRDEAKMDVLWVRDDPGLRRQQDDPFHYQKARELGRYLLTHDEDFWDDRRYTLQTCPGLIILPENDEGMAKYLPRLLRNLIRDTNPTDEALYLNGTKTRITWETLTIKVFDREAQKKIIETSIK